MLKTSLDMVLDFPRDQARALTSADVEGSLSISVNSFVFERPGATVLIDAGAGDTMQPTLGRLPADLAASGTPAEAITHILLTHLHPDHANGLTAADGLAVFPNAELLLSAPEFDFWMGEGDAHDSDSVRRMRARNYLNLAPYRNRIRRVRDGEAALGCAPILAPGHSPGHTCWLIETGGEAMLAWGDIVHFANLQISHPDVSLTYDLDPGMARRSRARMLDLAVAERLMVAGAHLDAPGLGHIVRRSAGHAFVPVA